MNRLHDRQSIRLKEFDYSSPGAYFVTVCTQLRGFEWFGRVTRDGVVLNPAGEMILGVWNQIPQFYPKIQTDTFVIMPDHIHGIIIIEPSSHLVGADPRVRPVTHDDNNDSLKFGLPVKRFKPKQPNIDLEKQPEAKAFGGVGRTQGSAPTDVGNLSLSEVMQRFKSLTTNRYIHGVRNLGWKPFEKRFWQRDYYEHIIQTEVELEKTREYILYNPMRWLEAKGIA